MSLVSNRYCYFFSFAILFITPVVLAQSIEKPLFTWLPLLTSDLQLLQPNQHCPQNKIVNIQIRKEKNNIETDIAAVDWDLNCQTAQTKRGSTHKSYSLVQQKDHINLQIKALFKFLAVFPETNIRIKAVNLHADLLDKKLAFSAFIKKTAEHLFITLSGEQLDLKLKVNLFNKQLSLESTVTLEEIEKFINLPDRLKKLSDNELKIAYLSDLNHWEEGTFTLNSQGKLADLAEQVELTAAGDLDLLTQQINLKSIFFNLRNISYKISRQQEWQAAYIKLQLTEPALINLSAPSSKSFPLQLRVGRSALLTKLPLGKSQRIRVDKQKLPPLFAAINAQGALHNMTLDWRLSLLDQTLTGKLLYAQNELKLKLEVPDTPLSAQKLVEALRSYLPDLQLVEINSGDINLQLSAYYDLKRKVAGVESTINATDIAGKNDNVLFDGVTLNSYLDYRLEKQQIIVDKDKQQLKIANLFIGVPVQALQLDAQLNAGELVVDHFKARLLGGRIDFTDFRLKAPSQTLLNLSGFSLSEVIKYSAYPEIKSKAIIDGVLPLLLTEQGPVIKNGEIFARHPGYIKVPENTVAKTMGRENPAFSFTMRVLSDLQFDTLRGVLDYAADGESELKVEIKGVNPNVSGTRPVVFNYSHNENILKLLKSLRFNEQLIKQIEERY